MGMLKLKCSIIYITTVFTLTAQIFYRLSFSNKATFLII